MLEKICKLHTQLHRASSYEMYVEMEVEDLGRVYLACKMAAGKIQNMKTCSNCVRNVFFSLSVTFGPAVGITI